MPGWMSVAAHRGRCAAGKAVQASQDCPASALIALPHHWSSAYIGNMLDF